MMLVLNNRTYARQIVVARFLIPIYRGFIGRWQRCLAAMNRRRYQDYCAIVLAQPARSVARLFLVFALTVQLRKP